MSFSLSFEFPWDGSTMVRSYCQSLRPDSFEFIHSYDSTQAFLWRSLHLDDGTLFIRFSIETGRRQWNLPIPRHFHELDETLAEHDSSSRRWILYRTEIRHRHRRRFERLCWRREDEADNPSTLRLLAKIHFVKWVDQQTCTFSLRWKNRRDY